MLKRRRIPLLYAALVGVPLAALPGGSMALAILGIGFLIFIHEWGHFYACKLTGTRTETFSIGFGPRLFGWEKDAEGNRRFTTGARQLDPNDHAMDFRIALIPLGGYVKMAGELPGESTSGAPDEFPQKSASARAFIVSAGVIMNFLTAILFYSIAYGGGKPHQPAVIGRTVPGGPAHAAGLRPGDRVLELNGARIEDRIDLLTEAAMMPRGEEVDVVFERDGKRMGPIPLRARYDEKEGRMLVGITTPGFGVEYGKGEDKFAIGPRESVVVQGIRVVGGDAAMDRVEDLLRLGVPAIDLQAGERSYTLKPAPLDKQPEELPVRLGIEPFRTATVNAVKGEAAKVLSVGDTLLEIVRTQGAPIPVTNEAAPAQATVGDAQISGLRVKRLGEEQTLAVSLTTAQAIADFFSDIGLTFEEPKGGGVGIKALASGHTYVVGDTMYSLPASPAAATSLAQGRRVLRIGERDIESFQDISAAIKGVKAGDTVDVWVAVEGDRELVKVEAVALEPLGTFSAALVPNVETFESTGFFGALSLGAKRSVREVKNVFRTIGALFGGRLSFQKNIAGPITLVTVSKNMADDGLLRLVWFLAYISIMLAVLNILPIPVLDGGHLLFILIEKIKGKPLSETAMLRFQQIGLLMLLVLMFFAFKNDIMRL